MSFSQFSGRSNRKANLIKIDGSVLNKNAAGITDVQSLAEKFDQFEGDFGRVVYVDTNNGNDGNSGDDWANAFKSFAPILTNSNYTIVIRGTDNIPKHIFENQRLQFDISKDSFTGVLNAVRFENCSVVSVATTKVLKISHLDARRFSSLRIQSPIEFVDTQEASNLEILSGSEFSTSKSITFNNSGYVPVPLIINGSKFILNRTGSTLTFNGSCRKGMVISKGSYVLLTKNTDFSGLSATNNNISLNSLSTIERPLTSLVFADQFPTAFVSADSKTIGWADSAEVEIVHITDWEGSQDYIVGDIVRHNNKIYIAKVDNSNLDPELNDATWEKVGSDAIGLRGEPVANNVTLTALSARNYEKRLVLADNKEYVFRLGETPSGDNLADDAGTGAWILQVAGNSGVEGSLAYYSAYEENDIVYGSGGVVWNLTSPNYELNKGGFVVGANGITVPKTATYEIIASGGCSNNSGFNGAIYHYLETSPDGNAWTVVSSNIFNMIEVDNVGSKSGGAVDMATIVDLDQGSLIRVRAVSNVGGRDHSANLTIKQLPLDVVAGSPVVEGTQSSILLGQLFYSTTNEAKPGLCYAGQTYDWADNPNLQNLFNTNGHNFITDNGNGTFTVVDHTDFIRAGVSNIGTHVDDTTAVNGLSDTGHTHQQRSGDDAGRTDSTTAQGTGANNQTGFNTALGFANLTGDSETAPKHRTAYFGIYGDLAIVVLDSIVTDILDEDDLVSNRDDAVPTQQSVKAYVDNAVANTSSGIQEWNNTTTYNSNALVKYGGALYIASSNNTNLVPTVNPATWLEIGGEHSDWYDIDNDQFSDSNWNSWAEYNNNASLAGNELIKVSTITSPSTFDFNEDGNPLTVNDGDIIQYQYDTWVNISTVSSGASSQEDYLAVNSTGAVPNATGVDAIALGSGAQATNSGTVQIAAGTNNSSDTLQYLNNRLANSQGLYTSHVATNYSPTNSDNVTSHFQAIDLALANASRSFYKTNRENIASNKQLVNTDPNIQILKNESAGTVTVNMPISPVKDSYFLIASRKDSIGPINVNTIVLYPGDRLELIYDGVEWFPL